MTALSPMSDWLSTAGGEVAQVNFIVVTRVYCRCVVDDYAGHFKDVDGDVFAPFVVGEVCSFDNRLWVFQEPPEL